MWFIWPGFQLWMRLCGNKPRVLRDLYHLYDTVVRGKSAQSHAAFFQIVPVIIVHLIAVAVAFLDLFFSVEFSRQRPFL